MGDQIGRRTVAFQLVELLGDDPLERVRSCASRRTVNAGVSSLRRRV